MKKVIFITAIVLGIVSCKQEEPKNYVSFSGTIVNPNSDSLVIAKSGKGIFKRIKVNSDGTFKDTLKVKEGSFILFDGKQRASLYLKNGDDLNMNLNTSEFNETLSFTGQGAEPNNYLAKKIVLQNKIIDYNSLMAMSQTDFSKKMTSNSNELMALLNATKTLDPQFVASEEEKIEGIEKQYQSMFDAKQKLLALTGEESPKFTDYENYSGGTTSLDDLKGKYVYIDVWATWCGPCKKEIPYLKKIEKAYHGKNIEFVSISLDRKKDYDKWRAMIIEKELKGIQLWAKEDNTFADAYTVTGIPRFILIDPQGRIVRADAPRPSSGSLTNLFKELSI